MKRLLAQCALLFKDSVHKSTFVSILFISTIISVWYSVKEYKDAYQYRVENRYLLSDEYYLRNVLKEYALKIESDNIELAKAYYANNGGDNANKKLVDRLMDYLFLYSDKYENFHAIDSPSMYKLRQDSAGKYQGRLYLRDCAWLTEQEYGKSWTREHCTQNHIKVEKGSFIEEAISKEIEASAREDVETYKEYVNYAYKESILTFLKFIFFGLGLSLFFSILAERFGDLKLIFNKFINGFK